MLTDITRGLFSAPVYPGDPHPRRELLRRITLGDEYNLSAYYTGCHTGTHVDAPLHYMEGGLAVDGLEPERFFGPCTVVSAHGLLTGEDAEALLAACGSGAPRILIKGGAYLTQSAAFVLTDAGVLLVGTDAMSIAPEDDEEAPHRELLLANIPILEGLLLDHVEPGHYFLCAFPLLLEGAEAAPVRAFLSRQ